jgi:steroid 5-alpha reductase family enzyme
MSQIILSCSLAVWAYMTAWFLLALAKRDNSLADTAWGLGFILLAALTFVRGHEPAPRRILVTTLILVWGGRLAAHVFARSRKRGEDFRYAAWRARWGRWFVLRSYLQVFLLQGLFLLIIGWPVALINSTPQTGLGWRDLAGGMLWLIGFLFESAADAELARFKRQPSGKGRIMTEGLWRYSRHPNYFGEAVMWWGIFILALGSEGGWTALASPLLITFLLRFVSGVPMLERKYRGNAEFEAYARRTNAFLPWPRKVGPGAKPFGYPGFE